MPVFTVISYVNFDLLIKVLSATFLKCKVTVFSLAINKYLVGQHFESMQIFFLIKLSPLVLALFFFGHADGSGSSPARDPVFITAVTQATTVTALILNPLSH